MPGRKRKGKKEDESDSEYSESNNVDDAGDDEEEEEYAPPLEGEEEDVKDDDPESSNENKNLKGAVKEAPKAISRRIKKRKKKEYDVSVEETVASVERKTKNGGYAHTNRSKLAISKANTGNTPWNKGRNRSSADKAKIAAGVRARNRAMLLEKLKRLGMSEDEYNQKKREIKYLRERVRRAKRANAKHQAGEAQAKLQAVLDATTEKESSEAAKNGKAKVSDEKASKETQEVETGAQRESKNASKAAFSRDVIWTPFHFGDDDKQYDQACPDGGPGGLICCEPCSKKYAAYLSRTAKDMEIQRTHKAGREAKEIMKFLDQGKHVLERAYDVAKTKVPPLPPPKPNAELPKAQSRRTLSTRHEPEHVMEWNLTSTIDLGLTGGMVSI